MTTFFHELNIKLIAKDLKACAPWEAHIIKFITLND